MEQKEFARADYKDLDTLGKKRLKEYRNKLAKELNKERNKVNKELDSRIEGFSSPLWERWGKDQGPTDFLNRAADDERDYLMKKARMDASSGRLKELNRIRKVKDSIHHHQEIAEELRIKKALGKKLKRRGYVSLGIAGTAALAVGGKELYDKYKKRNMKEQKEFARTVYETEPKNVPMETPKVGKERASKLRDMFNRAKEGIKNSKVGKNAAEFYAKHEKGVKISGGVAAGTALAAGLAVGAKKLADKKKRTAEGVR